MTRLSVKTPDNFSFKSTIYSHGWADLLPFEISDDPLTLSYTINSQSDKVLPIKIFSRDDRVLSVYLLRSCSDQEIKHTKSSVRRIFRLDEDYTNFYTLVKTSRDFKWVSDYRAGRMLRCASLWEDIVKMLCTTNCTWRLTQIMTENLVNKLGEKIIIGGKEFRSFPDHNAVALKDEKYLRDEIKMGYRAPYLLNFAQSIVEGLINLSEFENGKIQTEALYKKIRRVKGFGDYAVSNLLKLLGRYDYLGADSWSRQKFADKHNHGNKCDDLIIEKHYKKFKNWMGLFFWMDVSEDWYRREKPW